MTTNDKIAIKMTKVFGTMWCTYAFIIYGLLGAVPSLAKYQVTILFWSNWIQLWSLPLLMVGAGVISAESAKAESQQRGAIEQQRQEDHQALMELVQELHAHQVKK